MAGALQCSANSNPVVTMTGFNNNLITVLDVSQPLAPVVVTNLLVETNGGQWRASFVPAAGNASYSVAQAGSLLTPLALEAVWPLNLASPTNRAACVIIAPAVLQNSATALANYRNAQGLETRVIPLEAIYNEFNYGLCEPEALCRVSGAGAQQLAIAASLRRARRQRHLRLPQSSGNERQPGAAAHDHDPLRPDRVGQ